MSKKPNAQQLSVAIMAVRIQQKRLANSRLYAKDIPDLKIVEKWLGELHTEALNATL